MSEAAAEGTSGQERPPERGAERGHTRAPAQPRLTRPVYFADRLPSRLRRREDLIDAAMAVIGIALIWVFGIYANSTTQGVTEDVRNLVRDILLLPVTVIEGLFVLIAPVAVVIALARRRRLRTLLESLATGLVAAIVGTVAVIVLGFLPTDATAPLSVPTPQGPEIALNLVIVTLTAFFTSAGESGNMSTVRYSWWGLWLMLLLGVIRGSMSLPGALIALLLGRLVGSMSRWIVGFEDRRATGVDIVEGLLSIGIVPSRVIRSDLRTEGAPLTTWIIAEDDRSGARATPGKARHVSTGEGGADEAKAVAAQQVSTRRPLRQRTSEVELVEYTVNRRSGRNDTRHYQVWDHNGIPLDVLVVDPGREITGTIVELWNNLRLRGISRWISPSLKANAERATLTSLSAMRAGVKVPEPMGLAQAGDSVLVVHRSLPPTSTLKDAPDEVVTDEVLDRAWRQLLLAHSRGVTHRNLTFDAVVVDAHGTVWLMDWEQGEVATTELNRRIDIAQFLVLLAVCVGQERALESARRVVGDEELRASAPVLQSAVLPTPVNAAVRRTDIVSDLRGKLVEDTASGSAQLLDIERFAPRTVLTVAVLAIALIVVLTTMNFEDILAAITTANPMWILIAFGLGALTWIGGAIPLVALSTEKIKLRDATLAQVAASIVTVVAPAGIGPAALNMRFLNKQGIPTPMAVTTVTLQQISQFLTTVLLLLFIVMTTGTAMSVQLPYGIILAVVAALVAIVAIAVSVPHFRRWIWSKAEPTWIQVYPRVLWIVGQPRRLAQILGGNIIMNIGFIGSFWASLAAFGGSLDLTTLSITYLASNSLGSVVPSPGGIGPVEAALTAGLQVAGIPLSVALSTAVLYRLVTFYGRIPFGWAAMKVMQKKDLI